MEPPTLNFELLLFIIIITNFYIGCKKLKLFRAKVIGVRAKAIDFYVLSI